MEICVEAHPIPCNGKTAADQTKRYRLSLKARTGEDVEGDLWTMSLDVRREGFNS